MRSLKTMPGGLSDLGRTEPKKLIKQVNTQYHSQNNLQLQSKHKREESRVESARRKPVVVNTRPVPAWTSESAQTKGKADRYINKRMEKELNAYRLEIEKRFDASALKPYVYPR